MARLIFLLLFCLMPWHAKAQSTTAYTEWLNSVAAEAVGQGVSPHIVRDALSYAVYDPRVVEYDQRQPEHTISFATYSNNILKEERLKKGAIYLKSYKAVLNDIGKHYGVSPEVIVALWSLESGFGKNTGSFDLISSLASLAYEGRRAAFFRRELIFALQLIEKANISPIDLRGSWAGATGQCQFMPSTYVKYAVDFDQDGRADIWSSHLDVWASIANYLAAEGWKNNLTWGREVRLTKPLPESLTGLEIKRSLSEWTKLGVRTLGGGALSRKPLSASLIQPDGPRGRSFLVYDNFRALMRWNRSTYFGVTVGLMSDRIKYGSFAKHTSGKKQVSRKKRK